MKKPKKREAEEAGKAEEILNKTAKITELVNKSLAIIKDVGIENEPLKNLSLSPAQRDVLLTAPGIPQPVKTKLARAKADFTHVDVAGMIQALEGTQGSNGRQKTAFLLVAKHLLERSSEEMTHWRQRQRRRVRNPKRKFLLAQSSSSRLR